MNKKLIIIPTYNEIENIAEIINYVLNLDLDPHVLIIDDNSPDKTACAVKKLISTKYPNKLFLLQRENKLGIGTAYILGFKWALNNNYDYIFEMDADFSHNPNDLERLYNICKDEDTDVAIGSRYLNGVNVVNWSLIRIIISYGASVYVRIITGLKIYDPTAGFVCYSKYALETINLDNIRFTGYAFQIEIKYKAYLNKLKLKETSIIFKDREKGESKMSFKIFFEALYGVIFMKLNALLWKKY